MVAPAPVTRTTANPSGGVPSANDVVVWIYAPTAQSKAPRYLRFAGIIEDVSTINGIYPTCHGPRSHVPAAEVRCPYGSYGTLETRRERRDPLRDSLRRR